MSDDDRLLTAFALALAIAVPALLVLWVVYLRSSSERKDRLAGALEEWAGKSFLISGLATAVLYVVGAALLASVAFAFVILSTAALIYSEA